MNVVPARCFVCGGEIGFPSLPFFTVFVEGHGWCHRRCRPPKTSGESGETNEYPSRDARE